MISMRPKSRHTALTLFGGMLIGSAVMIPRVSAASVHHPVHGSIKSVVLTTSDLSKTYGGTFKAFISGVISNQDLVSAMKTSKAAAGSGLAIKGRVTGYDSVWVRGTRTSALSVTNAVSRYLNSSYPQAAFVQFAHPAKGAKGFALHFSPMSGVGDQALMVTEQSHGNSALGISFRRGSYLAQVLVGTQHGTVSMSGVLKLAEIEDHRIQANG